MKKSDLHVFSRLILTGNVSVNSFADCFNITGPELDELVYEATAAKANYPSALLSYEDEEDCVDKFSMTLLAKLGPENLVTETGFNLQKKAFGVFGASSTDLPQNSNTNQAHGLLDEFATRTSLNEATDILGIASVPGITGVGAALHYKNNRNNTNAAALTAGTISTAYNIAEKTLFAANTAAEIVPLAAEVGIITSALKEYQYQQQHKENQFQLDETMQAAENRYLQLHQLYAKVSNHFQKILTEIKASSSENTSLYKDTLEQWLSVDRLINAQIEKTQANIALDSAQLQVLESLRRMDRAKDIINVALVGTALLGPPGMLAGSIAKGMCSVVTALGAASIENSARFNHGVLPHHKHLLISNADSLSAARGQMSTLTTPLIEFSGPELKPTFFDGAKTRDFYLGSIASQAKDRLSCLLAFSEALPNVPLIEPEEPGKNFTNSPALKEKGKKQLSELFTAEEAIIRQIDHLLGVSEKVMSQSLGHHALPLNTDSLIQELNETYRRIQVSREAIAQQMGTDYKGEGLVLINKMEAIDNQFQKKMTELSNTNKKLQKTVHAQLFLNGAPRDLSQVAKNSPEHHRLLEYYSESLGARVQWNKDIQFRLNAVDELLQSCETTQNGKYIPNLTTLVEEIKREMALLKESKTLAKTYTSDQQEALITNSNEQLMAKLQRRTIDLQIARIGYLGSASPEQMSPQEKHEEIAQIKRFSQKDESVVPQYILEAERRRLEALEGGLKQPTPINQEELSQTTAIVSPNRVFFGMNKHSEMHASIADKISHIEENSIIQIMPLRGIKASQLHACEGSVNHLESVIEGLKTEMQWVKEFQRLAPERGIVVANTEQLNQYYQQQLDVLNKACENPKQLLGKVDNSRKMEGGIENGLSAVLGSIKELKTSITNSIQQNFTHGASKQLEKAKELLDTGPVLMIPPNTQSLQTASNLTTFGSHQTPSSPKNPAQPQKDNDLDDILGVSL